MTDPSPTVVEPGHVAQRMIQHKAAVVGVDVAHHETGEAEVTIGITVFPDYLVMRLNGVALFIFQEHSVAGTNAPVIVGADQFPAVRILMPVGLLLIQDVADRSQQIPVCQKQLVLPGQVFKNILGHGYDLLGQYTGILSYFYRIAHTEQHLSAGEPGQARPQKLRRVLLIELLIIQVQRLQNALIGPKTQCWLPVGGGSAQAAVGFLLILAADLVQAQLVRGHVGWVHGSQTWNFGQGFEMSRAVCLPKMIE